MNQNITTQRRPPHRAARKTNQKVQSSSDSKSRGNTKSRRRSKKTEFSDLWKQTERAYKCAEDVLRHAIKTQLNVNLSMDRYVSFKTSRKMLEKGGAFLYGKAESITGVEVYVTDTDVSGSVDFESIDLSKNRLKMGETHRLKLGVRELFEPSFRTKNTELWLPPYQQLLLLANPTQSHSISELSNLVAPQKDRVTW